MKTDLFQSCGHCWVFQICWHIECSTFTASSFRIWYSSTGIPSPPLALFIVMLPKAHLTSHSRMSGSRWVSTPLWLSGSWGGGNLDVESWITLGASPHHLFSTFVLSISSSSVSSCLSFYFSLSFLPKCVSFLLPTQGLAWCSRLPRAIVKNQSFWTGGGSNVGSWMF